MRISVLAVAMLAASACSLLPPSAPYDHAAFDAAVPMLLSEHKVAGVGIGIIRHGKLVWQGHYGEQGPGIPANANTLFNTASVAKTVTVETLIALSAKGLVSLDEPIHPYVQHPDLASDPRYKKLTPRLLLSHRAGLRNWPYEYETGRASFIAEPGTSFSYSGMGIELAAEYASKKLDEDFEALAFEHVLTPLGAADLSLGRLKPWMAGRIVRPMKSDGTYVDDGTISARLSDPSSKDWSAADDLFTTVEAYARLLIGVMGPVWLDGQGASRADLLTSLAGDSTWNCAPESGLVCADNYGHGLGWMVYRFGDRVILKHGGNDATENALVIYEPSTGNGAVILANGGNGIFVVTQILGLSGNFPEIAAYYRQLVRKFHSLDLSDPANMTPQPASE